jgi:hypothetical protein
MNADGRRREQDVPGASGIETGIMVVCDYGFSARRRKGPARRGCSLVPPLDIHFFLHNRDLNTDLFRGKTYGKVLRFSQRCVFAFATRSLKDI